MDKQPIDNWTSLDLVKRQAERYGDRVFCTFEDDLPLTFADFEEERENAQALTDYIRHPH